MILKEIEIHNFRSYYGHDNIFKLSPGLTLILGDNGDGKTTFLEALEWLFYTASEDKSESNISEKRKSELEAGESDVCSVSIKFDHDGEKELIKRFYFKKLPGGGYTTYDYKFVGIENIGSERVPQDGKRLLERCFDTVIRKYCLFKGESELNIFNGEAALNSLVDTFSDVRKFKEYVELTTDFEAKSQSVVEKELTHDRKAARRAKELESELRKVKDSIKDAELDLKTQTQAIQDFASRLEVLERNQGACEQYQDIKKRIESKKNEMLRTKVYTDVDYNASLLDEYWILRSFAPVLDQYSEKVSKLSREKRKLERQDIESRAKAAAAQDVVAEIQQLANGVAPLPWHLPDKDTMQEMIDEEVCKVCGRPAPKGSDPYNFMVQKLHTYLHKVEEESKKRLAKQEEKPLFVNEYIDELHTRSIQMGGDNEKWIRQIATEIADRLSFIQKRKGDLERIKKELQEAEDEKTRLLVQSQDLTEDMLEISFSDFKGFSDQKNRAELKVQDINHELEKLNEHKKEIEEEYNSLDTENTSVKLYQRVHTAMHKIMEAFSRAKEQNIVDFLNMLEEKANHYMEILNQNDFRGLIKIVRKMNGTAEIRLFSSNGTPIVKPGGAQKTTMYMSVLFAISSITTLKREEDYPLIFDAPTSSFGDVKENVFYNIIDKIDKQCIIVTKDLLVIDPATEKAVLNQEKIDELTCSVYRIKKAEGYDVLDLSTIQTNISKIK